MAGLLPGRRLSSITDCDRPLFRGGERGFRAASRAGPAQSGSQHRIAGISTSGVSCAAAGHYAWVSVFCCVWRSVLLLGLFHGGADSGDSAGTDASGLGAAEVERRAVIPAW